MRSRKPVTLPQNAGEFSKLPSHGYSVDLPDLTAAEIDVLVNGNAWRETWESRDRYRDDGEVKGLWRRRNPQRYYELCLREKKEQRARLMAQSAIVRDDEKTLSFSHWKKWLAQERAKLVARRKAGR